MCLWVGVEGTEAEDSEATGCLAKDRLDSEDAEELRKGLAMSSRLALNPPVLASQMLSLQVCTITPSCQTCI